MSAAERFNCTGFSRWINSGQGRAFRLTAGAAFLTAGVLVGGSPLGIALMAWSVLPLSAGAFDLCWISAALGGPVRGTAIRAHATALVPASV